MAIIARELSVTYAGYKVGGDQANRKLDSVLIQEENFTQGVVEYTFTIHHTTESLFATEIAAAEAAFRKPRQDLTISLGSQTLKSYSHSGSTGFDAEPQIIKRDQNDTGRFRRYTVRIEFGLPADNISTSGRRDSRVQVEYLPSRKRFVTISGTYTAITSTSARDQYEAQIASYATSVLNDLGGTYKIAEEPVTSHNDTNKTIEFSRTYMEEIFTDILSSDADIRREVLRITRAKTSPGDTRLDFAVERLVTLNVSYDAWVDKEASTDLSGKWESARSRIISHAETTLSGGSVAVIDEVPEFDRTDNRISATMVIQGSTNLGPVEYRRTDDRSEVFGIALVPVWSGDSLAKYRYQGPSSLTFTRTEVYRTTGSKIFTPFSFAGTFSLLSDRESITPITIGIEPDIIELLEVTRTRVIEVFKEAGSSGGTPTLRT